MNSLNISINNQFEKQGHSWSILEGRKTKIDQEILSSLECIPHEIDPVLNRNNFKAAELGLKRIRLNVFYAIILKVISIVIKVFNKKYNKIDQLLHSNQIANLLIRKYSQICSPHLAEYLSLKELQFIEGHECASHIQYAMYHLQKYHYMQMLRILEDFKQILQGPISNEGAIEAFNALPWYLQITLEELVRERYNARLETNPRILCDDQIESFPIFSQLEKALVEQLQSYSGLIYTQDRPMLKEERATLIASIQQQDRVFEKLSCETDLRDNFEVYSTSINRIAKKIPNSILKNPITITMVGVEYADLIKQGGLAEAIEGLSKGLKQQHPENRVKLIFPKYSHLPQKIQEGFKNPEFHISSSGEKYAVYAQEINGIECYFIEHPSFTLSQEKPDIYGPDFTTLSVRFATFSSLAADLIYEQKDTDIIHLHDWHVSGIALKLKKDHEQEWKEGKIPPILFTFHNNSRGSQGRLVMGPYNYDPVIRGYQDSGISERNENLFIRTLMVADGVNTVSEKFGLEAQQLELGKGISFAVKEAAKVGKLSGIINGSNVYRWNPETDRTLLGWRDIETNKSVDLSYGPNHEDILGQKEKARIQAQKYVKKFFPETEIDFSKPIVSYIGRFDSRQKGLDKFEEAIEATLKNGGQFICMGTAEDPKATEILNKLQKKYTKGVLFIRDYKDANGNLHYQQGNSERPGIGSLVRAVSDFLFIPSKYEPCGLVQFEGWMFGSLAIGSETGGLADTIIPPELDPKKFNGFIFKRNGDSKKAAAKTIEHALTYWAKQDREQKQTVLKRIISEGKQYSWTASPVGYSPVEKYRFAYENARILAQFRNTSGNFYDMMDALKSRIPKQSTIDRSRTLLEESYLYHYYKKDLDSEALEKLYTKLPQSIRGNVPIPYATNVSHTRYENYGAFFQTNGSTSFSVYAPHAKKIEIVLVNEDESIRGKYEMQKNSQGEWKANVANVEPGQRYQYKIDGHIKMDPYGRMHVSAKDSRKPPYSVVVHSNHQWTDKKWNDDQKRLAGQSQPMSIYEIHPLTWKKNADGKPFNYRELAKDLVKHCQEFGFTHVELMGILEHPNEKSWGYQVTGYFAPTSRMGTVDDFKYFVDYLHEHKIGIILDWVPAHFAKDAFGLGKFDGSHLFEASGLRYYFSTRNWFLKFGSHQFDYGKKHVREFLISSAAYWLKEMHIDGIRFDCLDSPLYSENKASACLFIRDLNAMVHTDCFGKFIIAEDYSGHPGTTFPFYKEGLNFDMKWHIGLMKNFLWYLSLPLEKRKDNYALIEESVMSDNLHRQLMAVSHDEVRIETEDRSLINKTPDLEDKKQKYANLRNFLSFIMCLPGKKLQCMGNEYGNEITWDHYIGKNKGLLDEINTKQKEKKQLQFMMKALHEIYKTKKAFYEYDDSGNDIEWIKDPKELIHAYRRESSDGSSFVCLHNFLNEGTQEFTVVVKKDPAIKIALEEIFNSDAPIFGGAGRINDQIRFEEHQNEITYTVRIPPLSTIIIREK